MAARVAVLLLSVTLFNSNRRQGDGTPRRRRSVRHSSYVHNYIDRDREKLFSRQSVLPLSLFPLTNITMGHTVAVHNDAGLPAGDRAPVRHSHGSGT